MELNKYCPPSGEIVRKDCTAGETTGTLSISRTFTTAKPTTCAKASPPNGEFNVVKPSSKILSDVSLYPDLASIVSVNLPSV